MSFDIHCYQSVRLPHYRGILIKRERGMFAPCDTIKFDLNDDDVQPLDLRSGGRSAVLDHRIGVHAGDCHRHRTIYIFGFKHVRVSGIN